jgi:RimJ/RimL family protein N-acetyltransferase
MPVPVSARLKYRRLTADDLLTFHALVVDDHVRRYLLDGLSMDLAWCRKQAQASDALFAERNVGLWLTSLTEPSVPFGFCGFIRFAETGPEPQLLYAMPAAHAGQGYATEMARALIEYVREHTSAKEIISAVDEPNAASSHVLAKLGFELIGASPGEFGKMLNYRLQLAR